MEAAHVAAVVDHGDAVAVVHPQRHRVMAVHAGRDLRLAALQQRGFADVALAAGQHPVVDLHLHVPEQVVDRAPRGARRARGLDGVVQAHVHDLDLVRDVVAVRRGVIAGLRPVVVEGGISHAQRIEYQRLHRLVVTGTQLHARMRDLAADETGRRRHRVRILEQFPEAAGRLHGAQRGHHALRGLLFALEQPFVVLARHAGAGADQVLHQHLVTGGGVAQLEGRIHVPGARVPVQLAGIDQLGQHQGGQRLGVGSDHETGVAIHRVRLAEIAHAVAARQHHLAVLHDADGHARHFEVLAHLLDELADLLQARGIQLVRGAPGEGLAGVAGRLEALVDLGELRAALLGNGLVHVHRDHRPVLVLAIGRRVDHPLGVRRDVVIVEAALLPAVARRGIGGDQQFRREPEHLPRFGDRLVRGRGGGIDDRGARAVRFGRHDDHRVALHPGGPSRRQQEGRPAAWRGHRLLRAGRGRLRLGGVCGQRQQRGNRQRKRYREGQDGLVERRVHGALQKADARARNVRG
ncbi:MAG: hypothetical protein IPF45_00010 [Thermomonas sp.]|nr:hypothetical protein [Thermomonas sp.]